MTTRPRYTIEARAGDCADHGQYGDALVEQFGAAPAWYGCPRCHFDRRHAADITVRSAGALDHSQRLLNERLLDAQIPLRFQLESLDTWHAYSDVAKAQTWSMASGYVETFAENFEAGRGVMLLGTVGTGKTHLACGILQAVIRNFAAQGATGLYISAGDVIRSIKETFGGQGKTEAQVYSGLMEPTLLVIDEIGAQHGTDFERQVLFEVINGRYERVLPTIVVSNLGVVDLRQCMGDRAVDRLRDRGGIVGLLRGESKRGGE
ncbi:ATP-binding protein [Pseudomonas typographi]|uniref:ATP-binding protein n=1 Tax=Pseudomonas typographi TaxID=2715964 RepID=A0ABR7YZH1_9PSED|nr:ATP-binding protein [Pseudomonas typographi]MBD1586712.1 ATP-binding protein [Pseudomonas typographi]MBD1598605.1 ATP-binding protein [Pseudomonas typographi]